MEYRKATLDEAQIVCNIVRGTKGEVYPHYYTQEVVDFFGRLHSIENITRDVADGNVDVLIADGKIVGTGSRDENHITRVYVLPEYRAKGYGTRLLLSIEMFYADKRYELFTSTKSEANLRMYRRLGYQEFDTKQIDEELKFVYLEK